MTDIYGDFDDSDDLGDGNDQEIDAELGTILSWDDDDAVDPTMAVPSESAVNSILPPFIHYNSASTQPQHKLVQAPTPAAPAPPPPTGAATTAAISVPANATVVTQQAPQQQGQAQQVQQIHYPSHYVTLLQQQIAGGAPAPIQQIQTAPTPAAAQPTSVVPTAAKPDTAPPPKSQLAAPTSIVATTKAPVLAPQPARATAAAAPAPIPTAAIPYPYPFPNATMYTITAPPQASANAAPSGLQQQRPMSLAPTLPAAPGPTPTLMPTADPNTFVTTADPNAYLRQIQAAQSLQYSIQPPAPGAAIPRFAPAPTSAQPTPQPILSAPVAPKVAATTPAAPIAPASNRAAPVVSSSDTDTDSKRKGTTLGTAPTASLSSTLKASTSKVTIAKVAKKSAAVDSAVDTENMTPEEKAKANRDRNREHARNTRLRKKAYLEKLKTTVDELCRERDTLVNERAGAANLLVEMHNTRTEVLMSFFALRSTYEKQRDLWSSILDESCFSCVMPVTPYRSFPASEVQVSKCQRTILGIDGVMADTASLHLLLNTLVDRSRYPSATVQFRYTLVTEDAVVAGNQMMARWVMSTMNATQLGARMEVSKQGMLCCKFNSAHKIIGLELMFDVMAFMLQLKQASGSELFSVVPNTVQTCQRSFDSPMVMTLAERPYTIVQVNKLWEAMTGFKAEDVVGTATCRILQGQETDRASVEALMSEVRFKRPASASLLNYTRTGQRFRNFINVFPLSTDSKITHYVSLTMHVDKIDGNNAGGPTVAIPSTQSVTSTASTPAPVAMPPPQVVAAAPQTLVPIAAGAAPSPALLMTTVTAPPPSVALAPTPTTMTTTTTTTNTTTTAPGTQIPQQAIYYPIAPASALRSRDAVGQPIAKQARTT